MEFYYYCEKDWSEKLNRPKRVFLVDKSIADPHPKKLKDPNTKKFIDVKRYFDTPPAVCIKDPNRGGYAGKYGKFMSKRQEARSRRGGKTTDEMAKELGLCYDEKIINQQTRKEEIFTKYIKNDTVPTWEWEQLPASKRRQAEKYGFLPMKELEAPAVGWDRVKSLEEKNEEAENENEIMEIINYGKLTEKNFKV